MVKSATAYRKKDSLRSEAERNAIVEANLGLIGGVIARRPGCRDLHDTYEDAYQSGLLGLIRAAELFDESRGCRFSTYAEKWIWQSILRAGRSSQLVRIPCRFKGEELQELQKQCRVSLFHTMDRCNGQARTETQTDRTKSARRKSR